MFLLNRMVFAMADNGKQETSSLIMSTLTNTGTQASLMGSSATWTATSTAVRTAGSNDQVEHALMLLIPIGCGDGINVWNSGGVLIGKIMVPGGVANFCFAKKGEIIVLNETRMWVVTVSSKVQGALLANMGIDV